MLYIPDLLWHRMLSELGRHREGVERVAYLDGVRLRPADAAADDGEAVIRGITAVVTAITIPKAELHARRFRVAENDMRAAGRHLRRLGLTRLAQVHTHGTDYVDHSCTDDDEAYSQRVAAMSIVLPYHATDQHRLRGAGIHVRDRAQWRRVPDSDDLIVFLPDLIDLRESACLNLAAATPATPAAPSGQPTRLQLGRWWSKFLRR